MESWKTSIVVGLAASVIVVACLFGPWFSIHYEGTVANYGLREGTMKTGGTSVTVEYSETSGMDDAINVFNTTQILVILVLLLNLLLVAFAFLVGKRGMNEKAGVVSGVAASFLTLITLLYFMLALPPTMEGISGFWGSATVVFFPGAYMDVSWGPGWSWYLMPVALLLDLAGIVAVFRAKSEVGWKAAVAKASDRPRLSWTSSTLEPDVSEPVNPTNAKCTECGSRRLRVCDDGSGLCLDCKKAFTEI